jgi:hypothetical protein
VGQFQTLLENLLPARVDHAAKDRLGYGHPLVMPSFRHDPLEIFDFRAHESLV